MLSDLRRIGSRSPDRLALRCCVPGGGFLDTTWRELCDRAAAVSAWAAGRSAGGPVVVVVDGTVGSLATMLGLLDAGTDVLLLEEKSSYLRDRNSPVDAVAARTAVVPPSSYDVAAARYPDCLTYREFPVRHGPDGSTATTATTVSQVLQLTSGSTGEPRVARQTLPNVLQGAYAYRELFQITAEDTVAVTVPLAHSYGLAGMFAALTAGATLVTLPRFSIRSVLTCMEDGTSVLLGTPMVYRLLAPVLRGTRRRVGVRVALSAGGPMGSEVAAAAAAGLGTPVRQIYGITEVGLVACVPVELDSWPEGSVGRAAPGVTLRVEPVAVEDGPAVAGGGHTGRLLVRTPAMFNGYVGGSGAHLTAEGYYDTGDLVRLDEDGFLHVVGRKANFINVGGRKVNPRRIERILCGHPAVREAFVFGVARSDLEEEVQAAVVLQPGTDVEEVLAYCRAGGLMAYEVPHRIHVLDQMPRTGMGKVDRQEVLAATRLRASAASIRS